MRILYVTTIGLTMGFFDSYIRELLDEGHVVDIATNETDTKVPDCYREWGCTIYPIDTSRSPLNPGNLKAIRQIKELVSQNGYDIVHCHTPIAAMCTRLACRSARKAGLKVLYTAHGFHFYKGAPLPNWLIFYPIEKMCSYFTDVLITINGEDYALARKKMKAKQIAYVPGVGVDIQKFQDTKIDRKEKRRELDVPENAVLLVSVGELNQNKNHEVVIRAMAQLHNPGIHYMIAGEGPLREHLHGLAQELDVSNQVHLLGYRKDIAQLCRAADICVFPSIREGLGLAAVEGMATGLPLIASDNRGTRDYAVHRVNALVCRHDSVEEFADAISQLAGNPGLRNEMGSKNVEIAKKYDIVSINAQMKQLYAEVLANS